MSEAVAKPIPVTMKTVTFDLPFRYPRSGIYDEGNSITVCEPNFAQRAVFRQMQTYVAKVQAAARAQFLSLPSQIVEELQQVRAARDAAAPVAEETKDVGLEWFADLGDDFPKFTEFVQKALTNAKDLAYVGSDLGEAVKDRVPVTDEVWLNIANAGGMAAVDKVLGAFSSFFVK